MAHDRIIPLLHANNFRDLGGYPTTDGHHYVTWGRLFRADSLTHLTTVDQKRLLDLPVTVDIDLRSQDEVQASPDRIPDQIKYIFNPVLHHDRTDSSKSADQLDTEIQTTAGAGQKHMQEVYTDMLVSDGGLKAFQRLFAELLSANNSDGIVFHCTAGKDRTGMSAYLILRALGVSKNDARKDYLLTNTALKNFVNGQRAMLRSAGQSMTMIDNYVALWSADRSYLNAALSSIKKEYGNLDHYLTNGLKLSKDDLTQLRHLYLTKKGSV